MFCYLLTRTSLLITVTDNNHNSAPCLRYTFDTSDYKRSISCVSCVIFIKDERFDVGRGWLDYDNAV